MAVRRTASVTVALGLLLPLLLSSCQAPVTLHVAYSSWVGYESLSLARDMGWLPDEVLLHRVESPAAAAQLLQEGVVQAAALTLDLALHVRQQLDDLKVVLVMGEFVAADGARNLSDTRPAPATMLHVLAVDGASLLHREEALAATIAGHFRALEYLRDNREDAIYRYAAYQGSSSGAVRGTLAELQLPALEGVRSQLQPGGAVERAALGLLAEGTGTGDRESVDGMIDGRYLPGASL